jgi:hypothetical protein
MASLGTYVVRVSRRPSDNLAHVQDKPGIASSTGSPTVEQYIELEGAAGRYCYAVEVLTDTFIVSYDASSVNAA